MNLKQIGMESGTHLIVRRQRCSNGRGYKSDGKRKDIRNNQKDLTCDQRFPFETVLRSWRYVFKADEKFF